MNQVNLPVSPCMVLPSIRAGNWKVSDLPPLTIWLEGTPSDSLNVSNQLSIHEDTSYMRDYVFEEGRLKEVHFDKVSK